MSNLPPVDLVAACDDPELLGVELWPKQREIAEQIDSGRYREIVLNLGRRSGKSLLAAVVGVHDAAFRDLTAYTRRGERRHVVCVAASREQARIVLDFARGLLTGSPLLAEAIESETGDSITVTQPVTGALVTLRTIPCSARTGRGLAISTLICDELAHWQSESEGPAVADRVYKALTPSLAQFKQHGRVLSISTPWGSSNLFYRLHERALSGEHPDMLAIHAPTWDVNPMLDDAFFEQERAKDPELYRGEYGAEFLASGAALINWEAIQRAVDDDRLELGAEQIRSPIAAIDAAFARDPFACVIVGRDPDDPNRLRLAAVRSWRPRGGELDVEAVLDEVAELCRNYGVRRVVCDQHCSVPVRQSLRRRDLAPEELTMGRQSKPAAYSALRSKLAADELELYRHEALLAELSRIEVHYTSGAPTIRVPRVGGSHGDMAQALALAAHDLSRRRPGLTDEQLAAAHEIAASNRALSGTSHWTGGIAGGDTPPADGESSVSAPWSTKWLSR